MVNTTDRIAAYQRQNPGYFTTAQRRRIKKKANREANGNVGGARLRKRYEHKVDKGRKETAKAMVQMMRWRRGY
jgi:hypothetical protein